MRGARGVEIGVLSLLLAHFHSFVACARVCVCARAYACGSLYACTFVCMCVYICLFITFTPIGAAA